MSREIPAAITHNFTEIEGLPVSCYAIMIPTIQSSHTCDMGTSLFHSLNKKPSICPGQGFGPQSRHQESGGQPSDLNVSSQRSVAQVMKELLQMVDAGRNLIWHLFYPQLRVGERRYGNIMIYIPTIPTFHDSSLISTMEIIVQACNKLTKLLVVPVGTM